MVQSLIAIGAAALLLLPEAGGAQVAGPSISVTDLPKLLKPGEVLVVIDDKGERTTGALSDLSSSTITLQMSGKGSRGWLIPEQRQFALGAVTRIDRRDKLDEGAWLGFAAGFGLAYLVAGGDVGAFWNASAILPLSAMLIGGPMIGALIDRAITKSIYCAPSIYCADRWSLGLSAGLQQRGVGISVRLAF